MDRDQRLGLATVVAMSAYSGSRSSSPVGATVARLAVSRAYRPGDKVTVTHMSGGDTKTARLTLDSDAETSNS